MYKFGFTSLIAFIVFSDDLCSRHDFHNFKESVKQFKNVTLNVYFYFFGGNYSAYEADYV